VPKRRNDEFYNLKKAFTLFALIDHLGGRCFVWKTASSNLKAVFEVHYFLRNARTRTMFESGKEAGFTPEMYVLGSIFDTEAVAFKHCLAWIKYFTEQGYDSQNNEIHKNYAENLDAESQLVYDSIKNCMLSDVCNAESRLFDDYGTKRKKKDKEKESSKITIELTPEQYLSVAEKADKLALNPASYVKRLVIDGEIRVEEYGFFLDYKKSLSQIERYMKEILKIIYDTGNYDSADLDRLQELCSYAGELHRDAMKVFNKRKYGKRSKRK